MICVCVSQQLPLLWAVCTSYEFLFSSYFISEACLNNKPLEDSALRLFLLFAACRQQNISGPIKRNYASLLPIVSFLYYYLFKRFCTFQTQSRALGSRPCLLSLPQLWLQIWTTVLVISLMINPDIRLSARSLYMATPLWPAPVWTWIGNLVRPVSKGTSKLEWFSRIVEITSSASTHYPVLFTTDKDRVLKHESSGLVDC